ncbi:competence type IV pilus minor pilin ComGD [Bacillus sp. DJP31]|uniref:competence type IV pilus minor pilin ComGD n=1 Tax=Bacillus sp. DJP31 TaxID=3409789 RepID=UPI003BB6CB17
MCQPHKKENGFTMIEMLIVLLIVMTIVTLSYFQLRTVYEEQIIKNFLEELQEDIWLVQEYAISHSQTVELSFHDQEKYYDIRESGLRKLILKRPIHPQLKIRLLTVTNPIKFLANGNINRPGTMYVEYNLQKYKIVFQLGRGRFRIEKL